MMFYFYIPEGILKLVEFIKQLWTFQQPHSSPHGTTRPQATETTSAHLSAHQILLTLVFKF
jgi:hypothetical protein